MSKNADGEKPFWQSTKFYYALIAVGAFLVLALTGTMEFTPEQTINFILGIFGFNVGAHALTNISAVIGQFFGRNVRPPIAATAELLPHMDIDVPIPPTKSSDEDNDRITPIETPIPRGVKDEK